jgi:mannitol-specific phosphotransferase system IIBC component
MFGPAAELAATKKGGEMSNFIGRPGKAPGTMIAIAASIATALTAAVVVSSLIARVEKLESDLRTAQANIVELTASQSRLSASIDTANRSIKSLRSDFDPQVRPLASILDAGARPGQ